MIWAESYRARILVAAADKIRWFTYSLATFVQDYSGYPIISTAHALYRRPCGPHQKLIVPSSACASMLPEIRIFLFGADSPIIRYEEESNTIERHPFNPPVHPIPRLRSRRLQGGRQGPRHPQGRRHALQSHSQKGLKKAATCGLCDRRRLRVRLGESRAAVLRRGQRGRPLQPGDILRRYGAEARVRRRRHLVNRRQQALFCGWPEDHRLSRRLQL